MAIKCVLVVMTIDLVTVSKVHRPDRPFWPIVNLSQLTRRLCNIHWLLSYNYHIILGRRTSVLIYNQVNVDRRAFRLFKDSSKMGYFWTTIFCDEFLAILRSTSKNEKSFQYYILPSELWNSAYTISRKQMMNSPLGCQATAPQRRNIVWSNLRNCCLISRKLDRWQQLTNA